MQSREIRVHCKVWTGLNVRHTGVIGLHQFMSLDMQTSRLARLMYVYIVLQEKYQKIWVPLSTNISRISLCLKAEHKAMNHLGIGVAATCRIWVPFSYGQGL